jgi:hypothetical protein
MEQLQAFKGEVFEQGILHESGMVTLMFESGKFIVLASDKIVTDDEIGIAAESPKKEVKQEEKVEKKEEAKPIKKEEAKPAAPPADDYYTWKDLEDMDREQLVELIVDEKLTSIEPDEIKSTSKLRKKVAEEIGVEIPEED